MNDPTEPIRRMMCDEINNNPSDRDRLEAVHGEGNVWSTDELQNDFNVTSFAAPYCFVTWKCSGVRGTVRFQHNPRLYFDFQAV